MGYFVVQGEEIMTTQKITIGNLVKLNSKMFSHGGYNVDTKKIGIVIAIETNKFSATYYTVRWFLPKTKTTKLIVRYSSEQLKVVSG